MLVNLNEVLWDARRNHYGVGLFNTINLEMAKGVIAAAEELQAPIIIGTAEGLLHCGTLQELSDLLLPMIRRASVPIVLHFDHGRTEEQILWAVRHGFTSIMYDCSSDTYEKNVEKVARMADIVHKVNVTIEGELGHVGANAVSAEGEANDSSVYTEPQEALDFFNKTGVDALAVAVGTAHGAYVTKPVLDIPRLETISKTVDVPLVLHGGSGLSDADFRNCIAGGVSKINIFTDINCAYADAIVNNYKKGLGMSNLAEYAVQAVKEETMKKIRLFGAQGKA